MFSKLVKQYLFPALTVCSCVAGIVIIQQQYVRESVAKQTDNYIKQEEELKTAIDIQKKIPSFGYDNLVADWNYLQYIQYFGEDKAREKTGYSLVTDYFEIVADRNPRFIRAFLSLSTANSLFASRADKTVAFLNQVLPSISPKHFPEAHFVWTYKGMDEILFLGDIKAAHNSYLMGAKWARERGDFQGQQAAARITETVKFLETNPNPQKVQIYSWLSSLDRAKDQKTIQVILNNLRALGCKVSFTQEGKINVQVPNLKK
jgi:hypothetical protein